MKERIKVIIACILVFGGIAGCIGAAIAAIVFAIKNPDMTNMRRLVEYPDPYIACAICLIAAQVGVQIVKED